MKQLVIRADAGGMLGTGHVMRMIALAQAYMRRGGRVVMVSVSCPEPVIDRVLESGIEHRLLNACDLGGEQDALLTLQISQDLGASWMVLDGYHFDEFASCSRPNEHPSRPSTVSPILDLSILITCPGIILLQIDCVTDRTHSILDTHQGICLSDLL